MAKKRENKTTFSKKWTERIMWVCLFDMQFPFVLALFDRAEIAETLAVAIVTEIVAVFVTYSLKAYFETKAEKAQEYDYHVFDTMNDSGEDEEDE